MWSGKAVFAVGLLVAFSLQARSQDALSDAHHCLQANDNLLFREAYCTRAIDNSKQLPRDLLLALYKARAEIYFVDARTKGDVLKARKAIADLDVTLAMDPNYAEGYYGRGMMYLQNNDAQKAIDDLTKAANLSSDPKLSFSTYFAKGTANELAGNRAQAISDYRKALEVNLDIFEKDLVRQQLIKLGATP